MRVLFALPTRDPAHGGSTTGTEALARVAAKAGIDARVLPDPEIHAWARGAHGGGLGAVLRPSGFRSLVEEARRADLVVVSGLWSPYPTAAGIAARRAGTPYVVRICGMLDRWARRHRRWRKRAFWWLVQGGLLRDAAALHYTHRAEWREGSEAVRRPSFVLPLPVPVGPESDGSGSGEDPYVLFVGRLHPVKALDVLIDGFAAAAREVPGVRLVLAGPDETGMRDELEARVAREGLARRVEFVGEVHGKAKLDLIAGARVAALVSRHENFGLFAFEAMASGVPCIVSEGVKTSEDLRRAHAAWVCRTERDSIGEALRTLLIDGSRRAELARAGRRHVATDLSADAIGRRLRAVYGDVLDGTRRSPDWVEDSPA